MTFTKVSVLVPTRNRADRLQRLIASFTETTDGAAELVFRCDYDDPETYRAVAGFRNMIGPQLDGYRSLPAFFNELAQIATGDVLMCGNDDMVFRTPGWPSIILAAANQYPDGLFDFGVTTHNATHFPFSIVSKTVVERLGFLWDPRIFWGDIFLRDVMGAFGRSLPLPAVDIAHEWMGNEAEQNTIYLRDPSYWSGTHAQAVAEAVAKLRSAA